MVLMESFFYLLTLASICLSLSVFLLVSLSFCLLLLLFSCLFLSRLVSYFFFFFFFIGHLDINFSITCDVMGVFIFIFYLFRIGMIKLIRLVPRVINGHESLALSHSPKVIGSGTG